MAENAPTAPVTQTKAEEAAELTRKLPRIQALLNELGLDAAYLAFTPTPSATRRVLDDDGTELPPPTVVVSGPALLNPETLSSMMNRLPAITINAAQGEFPKLVAKVQAGGGEEIDRELVAQGEAAFIGGALLQLLACLSISLRELDQVLRNAGAPRVLLEAVCAFPELHMSEGSAAVVAAYEDALRRNTELQGEVDGIMDRLVALGSEAGQAADPTPAEEQAGEADEADEDGSGFDC